MIGRRQLFIVFLLAILTARICDCQDQSVYHIKPDKCPQEECCSYPPPDCMTLSEYALNVSNNSRLELGPGDYNLSSKLYASGTGTQNFSIIGSSFESTTINCVQNSTLYFNSLSFLTVENVSFISCGVSLTNIYTVNLVDTSFSNSTSGALDIQNCQFVKLTNLLVTNNFNSKKTIVNVQDLGFLALTNLRVEGNSIGRLNSTCVYNGFVDEVVFRIDGGSINASNILVSDNMGPFGVLVVTNATVTGNGDWIFDHNQVCVNGSLAFNQTTVNFEGNFIFNENEAINQSNKSTAGLLLHNSASLKLIGTIEFIGNQAYTTSIYLIASELNIIAGHLKINNNSNSYQAASFLDKSKFNIINGSIIVQNNSFRLRGILCDTSDIIIRGLSSFVNNSQTPFALYSSSMIMSGQNVFENNAGILYSGRSRVEINGNSSFVNNSVDHVFNNGALAVVQTSLILRGTYVIKDHYFIDKNGAGIYASATSTIKFSGTGYFINNRGNNGGGIFMDQQSRIELDKGTQLHFISNKAVRGAAIFVATTAQYADCPTYLKECLVGFEDKDNVSIVLQHNKASPGASVIHVNFDRIEINDKNFQALSDLNDTIEESSFIGNSAPHYASDTYWFCFCDDDSQEICPRTPKNKTVFKGKSFSMSARVINFYGTEKSRAVRANLESSIGAIVRTDDTSSTSLIGNDGRLQRVSTTQCSNSSYTVQTTANNEVLLVTVGETFLDDAKSLRVYLSFNSFCPSGFPFNENKDSCECDKSIEKYLQSCEISDKAFLKRTEFVSYWIGPSNDSRYQGSMNWYQDCPHHYCITHDNFTFSDDGICANNRSGVLCGQCKGNYSLMLGGDLCGDCSDKNAFLALVLVFAAAGVLLIAFIFLTQITVTTGTINGLIFYANILNSNENVFLPEGFFSGYHVFISWLNLNFGFETCFFDGMDQIAYSGLQFAFPLYLWFLVGVTIVLCNSSKRVSKFFGNSDPVAVLATIILLSFNSLAQNVISIFYFSALNVPSGNFTAVWRYDGNVNYFSGNHFILLIIAALFLLLVLTPYVFVFLLAPLLQKSKNISCIFRRLKLQPFIHTYMVPFKPKHRYWIGLSIFMRAVLLILFAFGQNRHFNLLLIVTVCVLAISMFAVTGGIYDKKWMDLLEISFLINLAVLAASTSYALDFSVNGQREIATYISITVALLTFIGIVILHIYRRLMKVKVVSKKVDSMMKSTKKDTLVINESVTASSNSTSTTVDGPMELREPLLESQIV